MEVLATSSDALNNSSYMTTYEVWSLVIAILAIIISIAIPLVQFLYHKNKQLKLNIIPFEQTPLTLLFGNTGSYIKLRFCLECKNQDTTIKKIHAIVTRHSDSKRCEFDWFSFDSIFINWFGNSMTNRLNSMSLARPFKIKADSLEPLIIEFAGNGIEGLRDFCTKSTQLTQNFLHTNNEQFQNIADMCNKYKTMTPDYENLESTLAKYFFWKSDTYSIQIDILHDLGNITTKTFEFSLTPEDEFNLRKNIDCTNLENIYKAFQFSPPCSSVSKSL